MSIEAMKQALEALDDAANVLSSRMFPDAAAALRAAIEQAEKQEPVAFVQAATDQIAPQREWAWMPAPIKTQWGHDMVVADLAINKDHTVSIYCERDQIKSVEAMFATQPQQIENKLGDEDELIYNAWRDSEAYQVPMTEEGMRLAGMRFESFRKGWEYHKFYLEQGDVYMKDYLEHGPRDKDE